MTVDNWIVVSSSWPLAKCCDRPGDREDSRQSHCSLRSHIMAVSAEDQTGPFRVAEIPGAGRGLVATRDILAGETVLSSQAAVRGPCAVSGGGAGSQCVNCLKLVQPGAGRQCSKCCLNVCSEACRAGSDHAVECAILSIIRTKLRRNQQGEKMYRNHLTGLTAAVTTLRMVSLKWRLERTVDIIAFSFTFFLRDPPTWNLISTLMDENINQSVWLDIARVYDNILSLVCCPSPSHCVRTT